MRSLSHELLYKLAARGTRTQDKRPEKKNGECWRVAALAFSNLALKSDRVTYKLFFLESLREKETFRQRFILYEELVSFFFFLIPASAIHEISAQLLVMVAWNRFPEFSNIS